MKSSRRLVYWLGAAWGLVAGWGEIGLGEETRPNIVFILADDLGWTDVGVQGSGYYETPHIDRLAAEGMRFTQGYTCGPNCQPTRAALLSGQYGPRTGVYTVGGTDRFDTTMRPLVPVENVTDLSLETITFAETLQEAGYATGMFGKWHLGTDDEHHPSRQGFDEALVHTKRHHFDFGTDPPVEVPEGIYLADFLTDRAIDFIERHRDEPFLLYLPHWAVHSPYEAKQDLIERFEPKTAVDGHGDPTYAAMIASVDDSVGRIVRKLDELKLGERTLVIFSSDNGGVGGYRDAGVRTREGVTNNAPLRGGKGMLYEGGVRVPFVFRWPGRIAAGEVCKEPIISVDLYPTLAELAEASLPEDQTLDGVSLVPLLKGHRESLERDALYWHFPGYLGSGRDIWRTTPVSVIRMGDLKLLEFLEDGRIELYDVRKDVGEHRDLSKTRPKDAQRLHERLQTWRDEIGAPLPAARKKRAVAKT